MFKKYFLFLAVFLVVILVSFIKPTSSQFNSKHVLLRDTIPVTDTTERIFEKVEIEASFPGGDQAWIKFLKKNVNGMVATDNGAPKGIYTVIIQFVVDKYGYLTDIKALTNHGYGMEKEVIKLLKKSPKWNPAFQDGRNVKAYRRQPVTFTVYKE
jgi:periplasmic protein TonB